MPLEGTFNSLHLRQKPTDGAFSEHFEELLKIPDKSILSRSSWQLSLNSDISPVKVHNTVKAFKANKSEVCGGGGKSAKLLDILKWLPGSWIVSVMMNIQSRFYWLPDVSGMGVLSLDQVTKTGIG